MKWYFTNTISEQNRRVDEASKRREQHDCILKMYSESNKAVNLVDLVEPVLLLYLELLIPESRGDLGT